MIIDIRLRLLCFLLILLLSNPSLGQEKQLKGRVIDSIGEPIPLATITLNSDNSILDFAIAGSKGEFELQGNPSDSLVLITKSLGFESDKKLLSAKDFQGEITVILKSRLNDLDEVLIVEAKKMVKENKDTITYNLSFFTNQQEQTVEDVIKKLPGIEVDDDGTIRYLNKEISKMLIDGDDLVDDKYKLISQNLDGDVLKNVQVLRNYDSNPLRKKFGKGKEVALNLSIKDNKKNLLFGKVGLSGGLGNFYKLDNNLGLLKERLKFLNFNEVNNTGKTLNPIAHSNTIQLEDIWATEENKFYNISPLFQNEIETVGFLETEDQYRNKSQLLSLTGSYNSKKNFSSRYVGYFSKDVRFYNDQRIRRFFTPTTTVNYTESSNVIQNLPSFYTETELKYYDQESNYITFQGSYRHSNRSFDEDILLNNLLVNGYGDEKLINYQNHLRWTYQSNDKFLIENYGYFTYTEISNQYDGQNPLENYANSYSQESNVTHKSVGLTSRMQLKKNNDQLEIIFASELEDQERLIEGSQNSLPIDSLGVEQRFKYLNLLFQSGYSLQIKKNQKLGLTGSFSLKKSQSEYPDFRLWKAGASYNFTLKKIGNFTLSFNFDEDISDWNSIFEGRYLYNYRTFNAGLEKPFKYLKKSTNLLHHYENPEKGFLMFNFISYSNYDRGIVSKNLINDSFSLIDNEKGKGGSLFIGQNQFTFYSDVLSSSVKIDNSFNYFKNYLSSNSSQIIPSHNYQFTSTLSSTTYLEFPLQWKTSISFQHIWNRYSGNKGNISNWILKNKLNYTLSKSITLSTDWTYYNIANNAHHFLNSELSYKPENSKWNIGIRARNLLNVQFLETKSVSDIQLSINSIQINPVRIMAYANYRF